MEKENPNSFDSIVKRAILANNEFNISEVKDLNGDISIYFDSDRYPAIVDLIKKGEFQKISELSDTPANRQFLHILYFKDQNLNNYVATVYDNDTLEQDPQIVDIFVTNIRQPLK